jgi:hypothetical protein
MKPLFVMMAMGAIVSAQIPRAQDGHPDLQGIWTNATITPLERPAALANKPTLTEAEAKFLEARQAKEKAASDGAIDGPGLRAAGSAGTGGYNILFIDNGTSFARVDGQIRTSLVVDPPDGHFPANKASFARRANFDDIQGRPVSERCLLSFGSSSGPPMLPVLYNNNYQIVQTPDAVMILVEMVHDVRVIRMNAQHGTVRQWLGDSVGRWDGDSLVVETTNFTDQTSFRGSGVGLKVTERFTMTGAKTFIYKATLEDAAAWVKPFTLEFPFNATAGPVYEYACHEGNYAAVDIMGGARKADQ